MTREEQIRNAAEQCATHLVDTDVTDFHGKYEKKMDFILDEYSAFLAGAKFADEHPKSTWISVNDDLPCNHEHLMRYDNLTKSVLAITEYGWLKITRMYKDENGEWTWGYDEFKIVYWMPIPKLKGVEIYE